MQRTVTFNNTEIPKKNSVKYLGVTFQSNMKFNLHVLLTNVKHVKSRLWKVFGNKRKLNVVNKITIFNLYMRSILTYNIQIWSDVSKSCMNRF